MSHFAAASPLPENGLINTKSFLFGGISIIRFKLHIELTSVLKWLTLNGALKYHCPFRWFFRSLANQNEVLLCLISISTYLKLSNMSDFLPAAVARRPLLFLKCPQMENTPVLLVYLRTENVPQLELNCILPALEVCPILEWVIQVDLDSLLIEIDRSCEFLDLFLTTLLQLSMQKPSIASSSLLCIIFSVMK